ncbi:MAG: GatB/YqeY domain-containing protein [Succinivibrionaceae bacterium]|nr:GatB/YqeY domain-containing protein [Succinivibrionaceae bacterium]
MALRENLNDLMKEAMRSKDMARLGTLRLVLAEVKKKEIDEKVTVTDDIMIAIVSKMIKERKDSIDQYAAANRQDLVDKEQAEIGVISEFLPAQLTAEELSETIRTAIAEAGATSAREMGKVMAILKPKVQGRADMGNVSSILKDLLS